VFANHLLVVAERFRVFAEYFWAFAKDIVKHNQWEQPLDKQLEKCRTARAVGNIGCVYCVRVLKEDVQWMRDAPLDMEG
jgi:hypothetical protein